MAFREQVVDVRGNATQLLRGGKGPPLLYLHSAGGEVMPLPFFEALAAHFEVVVPAHPGFGRSEGLEHIDSIEDLVFHYTDLLDVLGLDRPHLMGLSLGAWLAAEFATRYGERLRSLVLAAPVGVRPPVEDLFSASPRETRALLFHSPESPLARALVPDTVEGEALDLALKAREATARVGWNPYLHNRKLEGRLYRIQRPTLVLCAGDDRLVPEAHCRIYERGIADARLRVIPEAGHAFPLEQPEESAKIVTEFCAP